ncbi:unnamed protein product [Heterosigma akashiwo]
MHALLAIRGFEKSDKGHVVYTIEVTFAQLQWLVFRRFNDFVELWETLRDEGRQPRQEPPKKRFFGRFDPNFLKERSDQLQDFIDSVARETSVVESEGLRGFLEFSNHVDWDPSGPGAMGGGGSEIRALAEAERLAVLVEATARALVPVGRMTGEEIDSSQMVAQRKALFKATDGLKAQQAHLQQSMLPTFPVPSTRVQGKHNK